jgi:hypothetical protein
MWCTVIGSSLAPNIHVKLAELPTVEAVVSSVKALFDFLMLKFNSHHINVMANT